VPVRFAAATELALAAVVAPELLLLTPLGPPWVKLGAAVIAAGYFFAREVGVNDISTIDICLVKHGRFYHPAQITIQLNDKRTMILVLNIAVSPEGIACIDREYAALEKLAKIENHLPHVFGKSSFTLDNDSVFSMFAAQWFEGYHEFHVSHDGPDEKIIVWDTENDNYFLSNAEAYSVYRQASYIMTMCYDIETCEQIQPWHHAAGDFVLKNYHGIIDVKLITVRQFTSLFENHIDNEADLIHAALFFLINLSIRMRLDRVDGIHEIEWLPDFVVGATVAGFMDALGMKQSHLLGGSCLRDQFLNYISDLNENDLRDYARMLIGSYHPNSPDLPVIEAQLDFHVASLNQELKNVHRPIETQDKETMQSIIAR
jgi:hypothetical protein